MITNGVRVVTITICECDAFTAVYHKVNGVLICDHCHQPRPNPIVVYDCPANCDKGRKGGRECAVCEGRGYVA
jgi:hypothetical protein